MYGCVFHKENGFCEKFSDDRCKSYCVMGPCQYAIPSHADSVRAMTDEDLAREFARRGGCPHLCAKCPEPQDIPTQTDCITCWLAWLKSPVEKDGNSL